MLIDVIKKGSAIRFTLPPHTKKYNYCFLSIAKNPARVSFVKILNYIKLIASLLIKLWQGLIIQIYSFIPSSFLCSQT